MVNIRAKRLYQCVTVEKACDETLEEIGRCWM